MVLCKVIAIYCSKKLEKLIGKAHMSPDAAPVSISPLTVWNAHLFPLFGRKCIILANEASRYPVLLPDILKKDLSNVQQLMYARLIEQLDYDGINFPFACGGKLLDFIKPAFLPTNNNRVMTGVLNQAIKDLQNYNDYHNVTALEELNIPHCNHSISGMMLFKDPDGGSGYVRATEVMQDFLTDFCK